ncbi:4-hydroxy-tetrahydrodipicolinate synthase [Alkalimarinus alittae]|uniref:4-hydroxy-tetrahydrodipicolinate synthase n=1 Tax=Alkalimarinus alittae TaxID=2961619 RepID=A0ABY6N670_9ALTE|nr:4-hydroxy-tetrahydrodipicolinate synthase [Alkalimarinus alittae]UZE97611.1 4-hydroxy-tetrahydrodipicolinate synthase [Alkalimarinus alittae]
MISGSLVALATPMTPDGALDWERLDGLVDFHVENGTDAIVAVGTTGESATLNPDEHCAVIRRVVDRVAGRISVIAGTGANSTTEAIHLTREAKKIGVDACLLVTPYYNKPTQEGLYLHYKAVAEAVDVDQILYNVPGRTAVDMLNETVVRLADIPNITGVKDATGNLARGKELIELVGDRMAVYSGDDATAVELILLGAKGNISVTANVLPKDMADMCRLALEGKADEARAINQRLEALNNKLFVEANPIPVKWALQQLGLIQDGIRLPLTPLSPAYHQDVLAALKSAGAL